MKNTNKTVENKSKETKEKKLSFIKKVIISIKDFDKYEVFLYEGFQKSLLYLIQIMAIFTAIVTILSVYDYSKKLDTAERVFNEKVSSISYENEKLSVNNNEKIETDELTELLGKIIVDTSELNEEQINTYKEGLEKENKAILFLNNEIILKYQTRQEVLEVKYTDLLQESNIGNNISKESLLAYYKDNLFNIYISAGFSSFTTMFMIYIVSILSDCIILALLTYLIARIVKIKIKLVSAFSLSVHALTLPLILNMFYVIINAFTGYVIKYFQVMYMAISFIYIITAIFMIKSDFIKKQMELQKIEDEQQKVREELQEKEQERKNQEEKERAKKEPEDSDNKENKKDKNKPTPRLGNKPEGDNA